MWRDFNFCALLMAQHASLHLTTVGRLIPFWLERLGHSGECSSLCLSQQATVCWVAERTKQSHGGKYRETKKHEKNRYNQTNKQTKLGNRMPNFAGNPHSLL